MGPQNLNCGIPFLFNLKLTKKQRLNQGNPSEAVKN
jgi:hypothetical protein